MRLAHGAPHLNEASVPHEHKVLVPTYICFRHIEHLITHHQLQACAKEFSQRSQRASASVSSSHGAKDSTRVSGMCTVFSTPAGCRRTTAQSACCSQVWWFRQAAPHGASGWSLLAAPSSLLSPATTAHTTRDSQLLHQDARVYMTMAVISQLVAPKPEVPVLRTTSSYSSGSKTCVSGENGLDCTPKMFDACKVSSTVTSAPFSAPVGD